jgi:hypothetical protein
MSKQRSRLALATADLSGADTNLAEAAERIQRAAGNVTDATGNGALAVALADVLHVQRRVQRIISYVGAP